MPCPPDLVNYLVVQISDTVGFEHPLTQLLPSSVASFPVNGSFATPKWVRAKWRRTTDPLDEGPWSNVLPITYPRLTSDEVETPGSGGCSEPPDVPVIRMVLGHSEFIELSLLGGTHGEGFKVGYGVKLDATGRSYIYVENNSTDPDVAIEEVALMIGQPFPQIDCHGLKTIAAGWSVDDPFLPLSGNIDPVSNYGPYLASPPEAVIAVPSGMIQYYGTPIDPPEGVEPGNPDYACLTHRCPEVGDSGYNAFYKCTNVSDVARTPPGFSLPGGGNYFVKVDAGICRAFAIYLSAGHTIFPPFLNVSIGTGHFAGFTQVGSVYVRFSTGLSIFQPAVDLGPQLGGIQVLPTTASGNPELDDFFVFGSEAPFAANLGYTGGWQQALTDGLPDGVHLVMISRSTNFLVSNLGGVPLDPPVTQEDWPNYTTGYYFRIGARRFTSLCQDQFTYSSSLSGQVIGRLGTARRLSEALGVIDPESVSATSTWKDPVETYDDLPTDANVGDARVTLDTGAIYTFTNGLWRVSVSTLEVVGEILWGVGTVALGSGVGFKPTSPKNIEGGTLIGWCIKCDVAGNGETTFDVHKNGTTIFTNQSNRPKLFNAQTKNTGSTIDVTAMSSEDDWTLDIDAVPGTVPQKVTFILYFKQRIQEP